MNERSLEIICDDGYALSASLFAAQREPLIVINSAMGVSRHFYRPLAAFLHAGGYQVLTYDYRGIGESAPASLRRSPARLYQWGELDFDAVLRFGSAHLRAPAIGVTGHSVGAQIIGLAASNDRVSAVLAVATQSGYWGHWSGRGKIGMFLLWHLVLPSITLVAGHFPARLGGGTMGLPPQVALDWARYGRDPHYLRGRHARASDRFFRQLEAPILALHITDDSYAPLAATEALLSWYENAPHELRHISPESLGVERIGHFGWFREPVAASSWRDALGWLDLRLR